MSGLCGWLGARVEDADGVLARMAGAMSDTDAPHSLRRCSPGSALACKGRVQTAALVEDDRMAVAMLGHPTWVADSARTSDIGIVAREFLRAFREEGPATLERLVGDFVVAVVDKRGTEGFVAVDRIGVRSLCYQPLADGFVFGSTLDALAGHPLTERELNSQALYDYLYFHMVPGPETVFRSQFRVPAGHCVSVRNGKVQVSPYWRMQYSEDRGQSVAHYKDRFVSALADATRSCADGARCGAFLSGGTDSSTIAGMIGRMTGKPASTYSIGFDAAGYDEMDFARIAARHFGTSHHEYYVKPQDVVDAIPVIARSYDQPFGNASAVPTYFCALRAREDGLERMLGGDGGDELYGGNARYATQHIYALYDKVPGAIRSFAIEPIVLGVPWPEVGVLRKARNYVRRARMPMPARYETYNLLERLGPERVLAAEFLQSVDRHHPHALMEQAFRATNATSLINQMLAIDLKLTLADNDLPKVTRMCEAAGMDIAFPMLDERVVDLSAELPPELKLKGTKLRYFFKEALREFLPSAILAKEKHGFGLPVGLWLGAYAPLGDLARDMLASLKRRDIVRAEFVDYLVDDALRQHPAYYGVMVWVLMMLEGWFAEHAPRG